MKMKLQKLKSENKNSKNSKSENVENFQKSVRFEKISRPEIVSDFLTIRNIFYFFIVSWD